MVKWLKDKWFLLVSIIVFFAGIVLILLTVEGVDRASILIAFFAFMYPFLRAVEYYEAAKGVRKVKAINASKIEDLQNQINKCTKDFHKEKKTIIEISIIDQKHALIHYREK